MKYLKSFKFRILFLVVLYSFVGFVAVPWFITNKAPAIVKNKIGINVAIGKANFNPFSFELTLKNVLVKELNQKPVFGLKNST